MHRLRWLVGGVVLTVALGTAAAGTALAGGR